MCSCYLCSPRPWRVAGLEFLVKKLSNHRGGYCDVVLKLRNCSILKLTSAHEPVRIQSREAGPEFHQSYTCKVGPARTTRALAGPRSQVI